jgi:hypothetical protein
MPQVVRYFEKSTERPGTYVEVTREYRPEGGTLVHRGGSYRVALDREVGGEMAFVPDMTTPIRLLPV